MVVDSRYPLLPLPVQNKAGGRLVHVTLVLHDKHDMVSVYMQKCFEAFKAHKRSTIAGFITCGQAIVSCTHKYTSEDGK